ncbi:MAG: gliding motility-associated C-terminal domain-containing protein [Saprospiraceae bacterium]|nr:gliding motility-associated C-terminal domain-containing protein [Saprospiraceae bacterium]
MMKSFNIIVKTIVFLLISLATAHKVDATHIIGGDISYRYVSGNQYEITLTLRRDCALGQVDFDNPASVGIFSGATNVLIREVSIPFNSSDTIGNTLSNACGVEGLGVCVQATTYKAIVDLPSIPGGYIISYQRCCRNSSLNNVVNPLESGSTEWIAITEEALALKNSSPRFVTWPDVYICANKPLIFNHSAIDSDGDSLVYRVCNPSDGASFQFPQPQPPASPPYNLVQFKSPYSLSNMMGGVPLEIHQKTGVITANPNLVGQFLIGICVEEYRNGRLISTVRRDFQYNVRICQPPIIVNFTPEVNDPCDSLSYAFKNNTENGNTYEWNFNYPSSDPRFLSTAQNPTFKFSQPGIYKVRLLARSSTGACDSSLIKEIAVKSGGNFPISPLTKRIVELCSGTSYDIFSKVDTSNKYTWIPTSGLDLTNPGNPKFIGTQSGKYKVTITNSLGCSITDSLDIKVLDKTPPIVITGEKNVCSEADLSVAGGNGSFEWSSTRDFKSIISSTSNLKAKLNAITTTFYVRTVNGACGNSLDSIEVTDQSLSISIPPSNTFCKNGTKAITIINNINSHNLTWTFSDPRVISANGNVITIKLNSNDTASFQIKGSVKNQFGCIQDIIIPISVTLPKPVTFSAVLESCKDYAMCFSTSGNFEGNLRWNFGTGLAKDTLVMRAPCFKYEKPGTYTVTVQNVNTECPFDNVTSQIVVPEIGDSTVKVTVKNDVCAGDKNVCFTIIGKYTGKLEWNFGDPASGNSNTSDLAAPCHLYSSNGTYTITLKNPNTVCPFKEVKETVTIIEKFKISPIADQVVCEGSEVTLTATSNGTGATYTWTDLTGKVLGSGPTFKLKPMSTTDILLKGTNGNGCQDSIRTKISIFKFDYAVDLPAIICPRTDYQIKINISNPQNYTFVWSPAELIVSGGTTNQPIVNAQTGKSLSVVITDKATGCKETRNITPDVKSPVVATFAGKFCANQQSVLTLNISNPNDYTYTWSPTSAIVSGGNTNAPVVRVTQGQQIKVIVKNKITGCEEELTYTAQVQPPLVVEFVDPNLEIKQGKTATISIKNPVTGATYLWNNGDRGTSITVSPITNTTYTVTVTDRDGCVGTGQITVRVTVVPCTDKDEYLPNAFTPNGDGKNDILLVKSNVITELEFVVYNRWGQEVFSTTRIDEGWDGTFEGKLMAPDVYAYYIRATCISGDRFLKKGNVSLLR